MGNILIIKYKIMKYYCLLFFYFVFSSGIYSQNTYSKYYNIVKANPKYGNEICEKIIKYDNSYFCKGKAVQSFNQYIYYKWFVSAFDASNNLKWKKVFNWLAFINILCDNDTLFVIGANNDYSTAQKANYILKYSLQGDSLGVWTYPYESFTKIPIGFIKKNDYFYVYNWDIIDEKNNKLELQKIDKNGNKIFEKTLIDHSINTAQSFTETKDGNFLATFMVGISGTASIVMKIDTMGNILWLKNDYDEEGLFEHITKAVELDDGSIVYNTTHTIMDFDSLYYQGLYQIPNVMKRITSDGKTQLWRLQINKPNTDFHFSIIDLYHAANNDIIVLGIHKMIDSLTINDTLGYYDFINSWIFRVNSSGKILWEKQIKDSINIFNNQFASMIEEENGDLLIAGAIKVVDSTWNDNTMSWILRLDKDGCFTPDCSQSDSIVYITSGIIDFPANVTKLNIFPNPANDYINISPPEDFKMYRWRIFDISGRLLKRGENNKIIDISSFDSGTYFIQIQKKSGHNDNGIIAVGKFIKN